MESSAKKNILISGASIAGLSTAFWMNKLGYKVTVVEMANEPRTAGAAIDIKGATVDVVKCMGIFDQLKANRLQVERVEFKNADDVTEGSIVLQSDGEKPADDEIEIEREKFIGILFNSLKNDVEFMFNNSITALNETKDDIKINFKTGPQRVFHLVIGCDGAHSGVRKIWFGDEAEYAHFMGAYFGLSIVNKLLVKQKTMQMFNVPDKAIMLNAYQNKTDIIFCFNSDEEFAYDYRDTERQRNIILEQFTGQGWRTAELLEEVQHSGNFYFDRMCQVKMPSWTKGRVALVGDAGYCASPAAGMGASLSISGAAALADGLQKNDGNFESAFRDYNKDFRPFIEEVQAAAQLNVKNFILRTEEEIHKRNIEARAFNCKRNMLIHNKQIAIVGGGPGGLTLARLLQMKGANVKVYERDFNKNARFIGSPLDLHDESGLAAVRKANLLDEFKKNFRPGADKKLIVDENAAVFFSDHETKLAEDFGSTDFRPEIDRGPLRSILLDSLQPGTVVWDSHFVSMEKQDEGWLLHFKNGSSAYADLVIAADGTNSRIRPYITGIKPFYTGITMVEVNILDAKNSAPRICSMLNGGKLMAFGNEKNLLMGMKGNGDLTFYASYKADIGHAANKELDYSDRTQLLEWFKKEYAGWSSFWYELFENAVMPCISRPIYCMPLDQTWDAQPNLTMLGDAAHVMPPFAGEGANTAMLDALELSECLTSDKYFTLQEAISVYEINMRKRASAAAKKSLENGERMHSEGALGKMLAFFCGK